MSAKTAAVDTCEVCDHTGPTRTHPCRFARACACWYGVPCRPLGASIAKDAGTRAPRPPARTVGDRGMNTRATSTALDPTRRSRQLARAARLATTGPDRVDRLASRVTTAETILRAAIAQTGGPIVAGDTIVDELAGRIIVRQAPPADQLTLWQS